MKRHRGLRRLGGLPSLPGPFLTPRSPRHAPLSAAGQIGEGTYGVVFKAKDLDTGTPVALKRIRLDVEEDGVPSTSIREVAVLRTMAAPNVVSLLDVHHREGELWLVFEWLDRDLKQYMDGTGPMPLPLIKSYLKQILMGVEYCHRRGVMHRDLKPQNLLVRPDGAAASLLYWLLRVAVSPFVFAGCRRAENCRLWPRPHDVRPSQAPVHTGGDHTMVPRPRNFAGSTGVQHARRHLVGRVHLC